MKLRRAVLALLLGAVLLLPSPSWSHGSRGSTASLTGLITTIAGGIQVSITNNGPDTTNWIWIRLVPSVHHTGATMDGGGCGPGGDTNTVRCGIAAPGFQVGSTHLVRITTDGPYPPNGGAQLFTSEIFSGPLVPAGAATGPSAPPGQPCKCTSLTARILPNSLAVHDRFPKPAFYPTNYMDLSFRVHWSVTCSKGTSGCQAYLHPLAPKGRTYSTTFLVNGHKYKRIAIDCKGSCGKMIEGSEVVHIYSDNLEPHDRKAAGRIPFVMERECFGVAKKLPPIRLSIAFKANGNVDVSHSKLH